MFRSVSAEFTRLVDSGVLDPIARKRGCSLYDAYKIFKEKNGVTLKRWIE